MPSFRIQSSGLCFFRNVFCSPGVKTVALINATREAAECAMTAFPRHTKIQDDGVAYFNCASMNKGEILHAECSCDRTLVSLSGNCDGGVEGRLLCHSDLSTCWLGVCGTRLDGLFGMLRLV
jgi:hypothetical protein